MRDIIFRGKTKEGFWVEGFLTTNLRSELCIKLKTSPMFYPVDPETVGLYTGLKDVHSNPIYEGDVLQWEPCCVPRYVEFYKGEFCIFNECGEPVNRLCRLNELYRIIGNIHDNPELLEK